MKENDYCYPSVSTSEYAPNNSPPRLNRDEEDCDSSLLRDTLAVHIGQVGDLLLQRTFACSSTVRSYFAWLESVADEPIRGDESQHELARAGLGHEGSLKLVARPRVDEFLAYLEHPDFAAIISLAFAVSDRELIGLHVVGFDGKPMLATRWLQGLKRALTRKDGPRRSASFN